MTPTASTPADAAVVAPAPPRPRVRGDACTREQTCAGDMLCMPLPGGYCSSLCGVTGTPCTDGTCVETARAGEVCAKGCTKDADCRAGEGYVCDPVWHACLIPNTAAIVPKQCPAPAGLAHDKAFAASETMSARAPGIYQFEPSAVVRSHGDVQALFISRSGIMDPNALVLAGAGDGFFPATGFALETGRPNNFDPWLARDSKDVLYAVWLGFVGRDEQQQIGFSSSKNTTTWTTPVAVDAPGDCAEGEEDCLDKPMIVVGPKDELYVMYAAGDGLRVRASRDHGATWSTPVTALAGIYGNAAVGADGRLHIVTLDGGPMGAFGSADQKVEYVVSADGGKTFSKPQTISGRDETLPFFFSNPGIAVDGRRGWIYTVYTRGGRDGVWDLVISASKDKGKTWKRTRIGDGCAIHMVPNIVVDPNTGTLHVAWYDSRGTVGRFAHATCAPGAATCVQKGAINDQPFAALSTERHGAKWIGEYEALFVDAKRKLLHAVWSQPVAEGDKIVSRIFHAVAKM